MRFCATALVFAVLFFSSCNKYNDNKPTDEALHSASRIAATTLIENFESGTKGSYTAADVTLATGVWNLNDALIGNSSSDAKNGAQSARVRNSGVVAMKFDYTSGASTISVSHAKYGSDASGTWQLWYSVNGGSTYLLAGSTITSSTTTLQTAIFTLNITGSIRFQIRKTDGGTNRINIDDFSVSPYAGTNPLPGLTSISPSSISAGSGGFTLQLTGSNFINGSVVNWNSTALSTTFVSATQLTASVSSSLVATSGSAQVTVFNPAPGGGTSSASTFTITPVVTVSGKKFLFDATKAETSGNGDWVIDEDNSNPVHLPTPAQANITSSTSETYWTGALSSWGIALVKKGNSVETLTSGNAITYNNSSNTLDLSHYDVFVVDEPNTRFTSAEKTAILNFVHNGGGLFIISDHTVSDRNNDGWDSPAIWNDLFTNNTLQSNPFGLSIDLTNISETSTNVLTNSSQNPILNGSQGSVSKIEFNNGATITLNASVNPAVQGLIWQSSFSQSSTHVMCASSTYGSGRVFVVTDSSPMDDGTGAAGNNLFVSWNKYSHTQLFMNASLWLAKLQ